MSTTTPTDALQLGALAARVATELANVGTTATARVLELALDAGALARVLEQLEREHGRR